MKRTTKNTKSTKLRILYFVSFVLFVVTPVLALQLAPRGLEERAVASLKTRPGCRMVILDSGRLVRRCDARPASGTVDYRELKKKAEGGKQRTAETLNLER